MEEDQVLDEYEVSKDRLDTSLNDYDFNLTHLSDLEDVDNGLDGNLSQESLELLSIPVSTIYAQLGLSLEEFTQESLGEVISNGWERFVVLLKRVIKSIGDFFKRIWNYIVSIFNKKGTQQKKEASEVSNPNKEVSLDQQVTDYLFYKFKNTETTVIDATYIRRKFIQIEKLYEALLGDLDSESDLNVDNYKELRLDEFVNDEWPIGYRLLKDANDGVRDYKYKFQKLLPNSPELKDISDIKTADKHDVLTNIDQINHLSNYVEKGQRITDKMERNINNYNKLLMMDTQTKKINQEKRKKYLTNLYLIFGLLRNLGHMQVEFSSLVLRYNEVSIKAMI